MKSDYTYKFRIFPAEAQSTLLNKHFGSIRWVYNHFLDRRNNFYLNAKEKQLAKKSLNYLDDAKHLTELKQQPETEWLYECNAQSLQHALKHLDGAFNRNAANNILKQGLNLTNQNRSGTTGLYL